ncbi:hypothetical protein [Adhaeretor mobilis]|uniref:hypothetical protein n=1 Tax=Adhaeretor mobilis TaxID=1930276 RepID=UPI00119F288B|nr:hypothetical protein [Adhaeretor mobilis]
MTRVTDKNSTVDRSSVTYFIESLPRLARLVSQRVGLIGVVIATLGCGSSSHELETAPVSGRVTLDGELLTSGYVFVTPSKGRGAKGAIQPDGTFVLGTYDSADGVQVGTHSVTINPVPRDEGDRQRERVAIPRKYSQGKSSGLTVDVQAGENNKVEWALTSNE